jgi:hypothetical protein
MDGYSVQEAASVLGVAEGRVWELLARGVLFGTPEGDSMRVFLKSHPGPIATAATHDDPPRTNGNGGSHGQNAEASAFRELLTEFRNLTERYGQALLALGEARGEVAGLRSRVDQLEARFDLRLPPPLDDTPVAWESSIPPAATPESPLAMPAPASTPRAPVRRAARSPKATAPRKAPSPREAVAGFAEALARAQDPNAADLGEAVAEVVEPVAEVGAPPTVVSGAAFEEPMPAAEAASGEAASTTAPVVVEGEQSLAAEATLEALAPAAIPVEDAAFQEAAAGQPAAEEAPVEVEPPTYSAVVVEPDWFADGDFAWLDAAEMEAGGPAEVVTTLPEAAEPEPELETVAAATETAAETAAAEPESEPVAAEPEPEFETVAAATETAAETGAAEPEPEPVAVEPETEPVAVEPETEPTAAEPEPQMLEEPLGPDDAQALPELEMPAERAAEPYPEPIPQFAAESEFEPWRPPEPSIAEVSTGPTVTDAPEPRTVADAPEPPTMRAAIAVEDAEEEIMWLGGEPEPSPFIRDEPPQQHRADAGAWPSADMAPPAVEVMRPPLAMTEDELARLALDEGWDEAEVAAIRAMITPPPSARVDLPGATELHEAMAALEAVPVRSEPAFDLSRQWAKPAPDDDEPMPPSDWAFQTEPASPPAAPRSPTDVTSTLRQAAADAGWLGRRQGPAAAAYRRLRRLFPG